jgi:glycosyltransferase involved in cell wall biosynthesis
VVVSDLLRRDYLTSNPEFPAARVVAIPNAVSRVSRMPENRSAIRRRLGLSDEFLFVSLQRYNPEKNGYGLIAAYGEMAMRRPEAHLVLAGTSQDARYFGKVLQLRDSLPCAHRIHLRDHTTSPSALLAAADGFVLDSFHEGGPLSSMEALCAGVPVVLSDVGCAREQVGDDPARGYVVGNPLGAPLPVNWEMVAAARFRPQANRAEFASSMDTLVAERERYAAARDWLAEDSRRRFSPELCVARHAQVLTAAAVGAPLPV